MIQAVFDTNVILAALKSSRGASHEILRRMHTGDFRPVLSVPLLMEYEDVLLRPGLEVPLSRNQIEDILDGFCQAAVNQEIHFLWRPFLPDPKDDMVFETALASGSPYIVTFNLSDFQVAASFGIVPLTPSQFLSKL